VQRLSKELSERELRYFDGARARHCYCLNIGENCQTHVNRILSKLGVNDRTQAVIVAVKRGIVICSKSY